MRLACGKTSGAASRAVSTARRPFSSTACGTTTPGSWSRCSRRWKKRSPPDARLKPRLGARSEEHTSELQSRVDLVCRLLLEKKKGKHQLLNALQTQTGYARDDCRRQPQESSRT